MVDALRLSTLRNQPHDKTTNRQTDESTKPRPHPTLPRKQGRARTPDETTKRQNDRPQSNCCSMAYFISWALFSMTIFSSRRVR